MTEDMTEELNGINRKIKLIRGINVFTDLILRFFLLAALLFAAECIYDNYGFGERTAAYHKGDTWLTMTGTNIDYPVVQGRDNFEYLDKDLQRNFSPGGSLFLDYRNKPGFVDSFNVIYGHNMTGGRMFADLKEYYDQDFFDAHPDGMLFTPEQNYHLNVIGIYKADAYASGVYGRRSVNSELLGTMLKCKPQRKLNVRGRQILALSTCSTAMDDSRDVLFCTMTKTDKEYADLK